MRVETLVRKKWQIGRCDWRRDNDVIVLHEYRISTDITQELDIVVLTLFTEHSN